MQQPSGRFSEAEIATTNLRLVEAVIAHRRTLEGWPQTLMLYLQRFLGCHTGSAKSDAAEARMLLVLARYDGPALWEVPPLRAVVELIALQGGVTVVQRTLWGVAFVDNALQKVLIDVIPEFKGLAGRYPGLFCAAHDPLMWVRNPSKRGNADATRDKNA